ncbi:MAG: hypothetical protein KA340_14465, partial [Saprospiraceae bacterium]|nr:hypothetical protein [Saprospiraceae bacterium]
MTMTKPNPLLFKIKLIPFFILMVQIFTPASVFAQGCLTQGIVFTTQSQLDQFKADNPTCKVIEDDLVIGSYSVLIGKNKDIINLTPLSNIEEVKGNLIISSLENLIDLAAFSKLK